MKLLLDTAIDLEEVVRVCRIGIKQRQPDERDRSKWHISNLLNAGREIVRGNVVYPDYEGEVKGIMSFGSLWELMMDCYLADYATQHDGLYIPDVEQSKDDILGSLDGVMILPDIGTLVCETKLRFTLSNEIPLKHLQQTRAYCHLLGTDTVCYVSGHLSSTPPTAKAQLRIIRFTGQSIEENWSMLVNTKKYLMSKGCFPNGK